MAATTNGRAAEPTLMERRRRVERHLLGSLLRGGDVAACSGIDEESFHSYPHRLVYRACRALPAQDGPLLAACADWLASADLLKELGNCAGVAYSFLADLHEGEPTNVLTALHAKDLRAFLARERLGMAAHRLRQAADDPDFDPALACAQAAAEIAGASEVVGTEQGASPGKTARYAFPAAIPMADLKEGDAAQDWLLKAWIARREITLLSALWKVGKTTFLAHMLRAFHQGGLFCDYQAQPVKVLYVTEEHEQRWAQRRNELHLCGPVDFVVRPFSSRPGREQWESFIGYLKGLMGAGGHDLVIFDTLSNLWPVRDENDAAAVQAALIPLHQLVLEKAGAFLVHHNRKSDGGEATAARGSGALPSFVDTIMELRRFNALDRKDCKRVLSGYGRHDETPAEVVIELNEGGYTGAGGSREGLKQKDIQAILADVLSVKAAMSVADILGKWPEDHGPRRSTLLAALKAGVEAGEFVQDGEGKRGAPYTYALAPFPPD